MRMILFVFLHLDPSTKLVMIEQLGKRKMERISSPVVVLVSVLCDDSGCCCSHSHDDFNGRKSVWQKMSVAKDVTKKQKRVGFVHEKRREMK